MKTLITGFDAFSGEAINPSELVIDALAAAKLGGVVTAVLPTSYRQAENRIRELIRAHRPECVLLLGLASNAAAIRLETIARNLDDSKSPDNDGEVRVGRTIADDAPAEFNCTLPLSRMADIARQRGQAIEISNDAGGFVCNHVFYSAAQTLADELPASRCGFVHLPRIDGPGDELNRVVELVRAWIAGAI